MEKLQNGIKICIILQAQSYKHHVRTHTQTHAHIHTHSHSHTGTRNSTSALISEKTLKCNDLKPGKYYFAKIKQMNNKYSKSS